MVGKYIISFIDVDSAIYTDRSKDDRVASVVVCGQQVASLRLNYTKTISQISMYYAKTRADNSGYTNHRVICLVVIGSSFNSEQVSNGYL
jgi:hypothetical protein